jgi:NSS family neurotransmitter:Na+ symporter
MAVGGAALDTGGPGLMFIYLINVFNGMPGGTIVGIVFYVCVLMAGITSLINLYEVPVAALQEKLNFKRVPAVLLIAVLGCVVALAIQGIVSGWMDAVSIYVCPLGAMLAGIMFFYVLDKKTAAKAVNEGSDKPVGEWFFVLGKFVFVPLALIALVAGAILGGIG